MKIGVKDLGELIGQLIVVCSPVRGKRRVKKSHLIREQKSLCKSVNEMLAHIETHLSELKSNEVSMGVEFEKALLKAFARHCSQNHERELRNYVSKRGDGFDNLKLTRKEGS